MQKNSEDIASLMAKEFEKPKHKWLKEKNLADISVHVLIPSVGSRNHGNRIIEDSRGNFSKSEVMLPDGNGFRM